MAFASLNKRLEALEIATAPFTPRTVHLIGKDTGQTEAEAIAAYEASGRKVGPDDQVILLYGVEVGHA